MSAGAEPLPGRDGQHPQPELLGAPARAGAGHRQGQGPGAHGRRQGRPERAHPARPGQRGAEGAGDRRRDGRHARGAAAWRDQGFQTVLLETVRPAGRQRLDGQHAPTRARPCARTWRALIARVEQHPKIKVLKNAELKTAVGLGGQLRERGRGRRRGARRSTYGVAVLATGGQESQPTEYLYGEDPRVVTHLEFDAGCCDEDPARCRQRPERGLHPVRGLARRAPALLQPGLLHALGESRHRASRSSTRR
ncbi:MAG: hypothetical protein MZV70_48500 [Desulfobacterales bacterium]|nr:hypothetical protein [Desulfobacterales bacterium]